ncbi:ParB N-terminal domain-containing protein [Cypionkella psychrotolerans]|uniref:ParB N-terminal domain-containing protein n=1 Tax=Cypionkella psychrotolerans TaxID=1678131 RepID=UPI0006B5F5AB|nr:ParB N-terminal domain-containing protein [Cypionkella psychrotolerans]
MKSPTLMKRDTVAINLIDVEDRLRPVSEAGINSLIASITELGVMKDPIHLRQLKTGRLVLIAGGHRLEAARRLEWTEIAAQIWTDVTDDWARLMEVDDNLAGAEMNALDTAVFLAERKKVYEKLHPESAAGVFKGNQHTGNVVADMMSVTSFAAATAEKFGMTDRHVRRMISAGSRLNRADLQQLRDAPKPVTLADLQVIAKSSFQGEHSYVVSALAAGSAKSAAHARAAFAAQSKGIQPIVKDPVEDAYKALMALWARAPKAAKRRFVDEVQSDLYDILNAPQSTVTLADGEDAF